MSDLTTKLSYLAETKEQLRLAIVEKGASLSTSSTFRSYVTQIKALPSIYTTVENMEAATDVTTDSLAIIYQDSTSTLSSAVTFDRLKFQNPTYSGYKTGSTGPWAFKPIDETSPAQITITLTDSTLDIVGNTHKNEPFEVHYTYTMSGSRYMFTYQSGVTEINLGTEMQYDTSVSWNNYVLRIMKKWIFNYGGVYKYNGAAWEQLSEGALSVISSMYEQVFEGSYGPITVRPAKAVTFATVEEMNNHTDLAENTLAIVYGTSYVGTYKLDKGSWTQIGDTTEELEIFEDLAETTGYPDEYEGTGGTDEEINMILDEIIGGNV